MLVLPAPALPADQGDRLNPDAYHQDFHERRADLRDADSWKLERLQHFKEDGPRRDALRRGDWQEALRLFEAERDTLRASAQADTRTGNTFHRLRIVEEPVTPYMQWELTWLRLTDECGKPIRVLPAKDLGAVESERALPELVSLGGRTLYRVLYTPAGVPEGALRFTDPTVVTPWTNWIRDAYTTAEPIQPYFTRAVAHLPPPPAA